MFYARKPDHWHLKSFLIVYLLFTALTAYIAYAGIDRDADHSKLVILTAAGTITGPMTGAISRAFQGCCLRFSLHISYVVFPMLLIGITVQCLKWPDKKWIDIALRIIWLCAWIIWFLSGTASFGHALS